jgi:cation:H+ antiporter
VVGSNIANILLILGLTAIIFPVVIAKETFKRDGIVLALSTLMCLGAVLYGYLTPVLGVIFVASLAGYVYFAFRQERQSNAAADAASGGVYDAPSPSAPVIALDLLFVIVGLALTILGARFLVTSAIDIARDFNVSETIIGLTIVAVGTSLPELVTSVIAALRKHSDIAVGNIVGSNIYNVLGILGVTAIIKPIDLPPQIASLDIWVMTGATVLLFITATSRWQIGRIEGALMMATYVAYCVWLAMISAA